MASTPEGKVKAAVKQLLKTVGIWSYMPVQNGMGVVGIPDLICCRPYVVKPEDVGRTLGLFVAIETKAPGKRGNTTPNQDARISEIRDAYGLAVVVDDVQQVKEILE